MTNTDEMSLVFFIDYIKRKITRDWWQVRGYEIRSLYKIYDNLKEDIETSCNSIQRVHNKKKLNSDSLHKVATHNKRIRVEYERLIKKQSNDEDFFIELSAWYENTIEFMIGSIDSLIETQDDSKLSKLRCKK